MFTSPKIFSEFPELVSYVGDRSFLLRPKQFHQENLELQEKIKGLEESFGVQKAFFLAQCQSAEIYEITQENLEEIIFADACFTKLQNISLNIVVADCVPILLYDRGQKIVGVVHAGWRGSAEKILKKTLLKLQEHYGSNMKDIVLYVGPSICENCYEIGKEVAVFFPNTVTKKDEKYFINLKKENLNQALKLGVLQENIEISTNCTFELPEKYFSYRREPLKANFVLGIGLKK